MSQGSEIVESWAAIQQTGDLNPAIDISFINQCLSYFTIIVYPNLNILIIMERKRNTFNILG